MQIVEQFVGLLAPPRHRMAATSVVKLVKDDWGGFGLVLKQRGEQVIVDSVVLGRYCRLRPSASRLNSCTP